MPKLYVDDDQYSAQPQLLVVEAVHASVRDLVRKRYSESGLAWNEFVFAKQDELITKEDFESIEQQFIDLGYKCDWSAAVSVQEKPELYKPMEGMGDDLSQFTFKDPDAPIGEATAEGKQQRGIGDNVVQYPNNIIGTARYVRSAQIVLDYMENGVPPNTIALIDDSGGTLTAPILDQFAAVICAGGTVRSHLGILTREYGVPCLMNSKLDGIYDGDTVEIEVTVPAKMANTADTTEEPAATIWRIND